MEKQSAAGIFSGSAVQLEQFLDALQNRMDECQGVQAKELEQLRDAQNTRDKELEKLSADLVATRIELKAAKQDLAATIGKVSSKVTNQTNSFANMQASITRLERRVVNK